MKCYKCSARISDVDKYCPRCGTLFDNGDVEKLGDTIENQLLNIYQNSFKFNSNFSLGYLIFNFAYAFYKKMYFEGMVSIITAVLSVKLILNWQEYLLNSLGFYALLIIFLFIIVVVVNVYYIIRFNELYIEKAKRYIANLVKEEGNSNIKLLKENCEKDSKGNIVCALISIVIFLMLTIFC